MKIRRKNILSGLIILTSYSFLFISPAVIYAQTPVIDSRAIAIEQALARLETGKLKQSQPIEKPAVNKEFLKADSGKKLLYQKKKKKSALYQI